MNPFDIHGERHLDFFFAVSISFVHIKLEFIGLE